MTPQLKFLPGNTAVTFSCFQQPLLNLEEALSFVEEHETNHSYGLQQQQQQQQVVAPVLLSNHSLPADVTGGFQFNADDLLDETQISNYTLHNQTDSVSCVSGICVECYLV